MHIFKNCLALNVSNLGHDSHDHDSWRQDSSSLHDDINISKHIVLSIIIDKKQNVKIEKSINF